MKQAIKLLELFIEIYEETLERTDKGSRKRDLRYINEIHEALHILKTYPSKNLKKIPRVIPGGIKRFDYLVNELSKLIAELKGEK